MLGLFRNFFNSRFGVGLTLGFLVLIALAFVSGDVVSGRFGGAGRGEQVASVGKSTISAANYTQTVTTALESQRQKQPALTMKQFAASGAPGDILSDLIDRAAMWEWGARNGMAVSNRLVGSELAQLPAFQGPDGKFDEAQYRAVIAQKRLSDAMVREDIARGLMARQLLVPASLGVTAANAATLRYAATFRERREGTLLFVPSLAFAAKTPPDEKAVQGFYAAHPQRYQQPEHRVIRYALLGMDALKAVPPPTDAEVAKRYQDNAATYAPAETRSITQLVLPDEAAARAAAAGGSLDAAARAKGLAASHNASLTREQLAGQTSRAEADAVFAAPQGQTIAVKGPLGWAAVHIDAITRKPGKTLDQARPEILAALTAEHRRAALSDKAAQAEEKFDKGASLADVARDLGLTPVTTPDLTQGGEVFGQPGRKAPPIVGPMLATAFTMEHAGKAQVAEVEKGKTIALFDVTRITPAAPAPLATIRAQVARDYLMDHGSVAAKAAADKVVAALAKGASPAEAARAAGVPLPPPQPVAASREQLAQMGARVPAPLALMFRMAKGTAKRFAAPDAAGWVIVALKTVTPGVVKPGEPLIAALQQQLGQAQAREYAEELRVAMRKDVGVKRDEPAIRAIDQRLLGGQ